VSRFNVASAAAADWAAFMAGYESGYMQGLDAGRRHERDETTELMRNAVRVVHALAEVPPRDAEEDQRQAEKRAAFWAARRGEVA